MSYLKAIGIAAVVAAAVAAFGASGAAAVEICVPGNPGDGKCPTTNEKEYTSGTNFRATGSNWVMTSSITTVTCKEASITLQFNAATGEPISGQVTALSMTNDCTTSAGTSCTVTVVNLPYPASLTSSQLTVNDASGAGAKVVCGILVNCTFTTKDGVMSVNHDTYEETWQMERTGGFCPATAEWHATFKVVEPAGATVL